MSWDNGTIPTHESAPEQKLRQREPELLARIDEVLDKYGAKRAVGYQLPVRKTDDAGSRAGASARRPAARCQRDASPTRDIASVQLID